MSKPRLLDLFCGAGGAAKGYHDAGFEVTGIDIAPQKNYPYQFIQADALEYLVKHGREYDVIHASPPCQLHSPITRTAKTQHLHFDLIAPVRPLLIASGRDYIIENVPGAKKLLINPLMLCGTMFGLNVLRHRYFETSFNLTFAPATCCHLKKVVKHGRRPDREKHYAAVTGHMSDVEFCRQSMGIDWMTQEELAESIPPAYTEWIGQQIKLLEKQS